MTGQGKSIPETWADYVAYENKSRGIGPNSDTKRANTLARKEAVLRGLLSVWEQYPALRLGQLLVNANNGPTPLDEWLFYIEDADLVGKLRSL